MQFLWKYIDEFVGKGLEWHVFARLLFFAMADLIPFALPLAVLLSSIMTYGNLAETSELVAIKSAGISLRKVLTPSFIVMLLLSLLTFYSSNIIIPKANLEFKTLLWDIREKKPAFNIKEGVFYSQIENFSIKVSKKEKDNQTVRNIIIYEKQPDNPMLNVIRAEWGVMKLSENERALLFTLYNGVRYEEMTGSQNYYRTRPHNTMKFAKQVMAFDLSQLDLKKTEKELYKGNYRFLNVKELTVEIDSMDKEILQSKQQYAKYIKPYFSIYNTQYSKRDSVTALSHNKLIDNFAKVKQEELINTAQDNVRNILSMVESNQTSLSELTNEELKYAVERQKKYTLAAVILVLFFLAAPLGAIIRRGGLGLPMVVSILLFILYYVVDMIGTKIAKEGIVDVWLGTWLSTLVLTPVAIWIYYKASRDAALFEGGIINKLANKLNFRKKVIPS